MQFLIVALDGTDSEALNRRMAVREAHLALGEQLITAGTMWYGAALWNDDGQMKGSMMMMDFPSEKELNAWLAVEPYVTGDVWHNIEIHKCNTRDPWQFNRPKEFYEARKLADPNAA